MRQWQFSGANPKAQAAAVELKYGASDFERTHYALLGLMCICGIELLADNIAECRTNLREILADYLNVEPGRRNPLLMPE